MKKIFTLLAVAALAVSANAEVQTIEVEVTWPMAVGTTEPVLNEDGTPAMNEDGTPKMKTVYSNALTPAVTAGCDAYITAGEPVLGAEIKWGTPRGINGEAFALIQPNAKVNEITEGHTVSFKFTVKEGYTFEPTSFNYLGSVIGTDGGNYNLDYTWNGNTLPIQEGFHPNRNNDANDYFSNVKEALFSAPATGEFDATFSVYNLNDNKQIGFSAVTVQGKLTGDMDFSGLQNIAAEAAAPVYYNLQGMMVENPTNGLYICKQGNKVTKVVL